MGVPGRPRARRRIRTHHILSRRLRRRRNRCSCNHLLPFDPPCGSSSMARADHSCSVWSFPFSTSCSSTSSTSLGLAQPPVHRCHHPFRVSPFQPSVPSAVWETQEGGVHQRLSVSELPYPSCSCSGSGSDLRGSEQGCVGCRS